MYSYYFKFSKAEPLIYISHLDLLRLLNRAARRANLPIELTQGFSPRFKIKLLRALKLGVGSQAEVGEFVLKEKMSQEDLLKRWQENLPKGMNIFEIKEKNIFAD